MRISNRMVPRPFLILKKNKAKMKLCGENYSMFNVQLLKVCLLAIRNNDVVPGWLSQPSPAYVKPSIGL